MPIHPDSNWIPFDPSSVNIETKTTALSTRSLYPNINFVNHLKV